MNTPGYEQWFTDRIRATDGRTGLLIVGKDDQGRKERFQWWSFVPDKGSREDMMIVKMFVNKDEGITIESIAGHQFSYDKEPR